MHVLGLGDEVPQQLLFLNHLINQVLQLLLALIDKLLPSVELFSSALAFNLDLLIKITWLIGYLLKVIVILLHFLLLLFDFLLLRFCILVLLDQDVVAAGIRARNDSDKSGSYNCSCKTGLVLVHAIRVQSSYILK